MAALCLRKARPLRLRSEAAMAASTLNIRSEHVTEPRWRPIIHNQSIFHMSYDHRKQYAAMDLEILRDRPRKPATKGRQCAELRNASTITMDLRRGTEARACQAVPDHQFASLDHLRHKTAANVSIGQHMLHTSRYLEHTCNKIFSCMHGMGTSHACPMDTVDKRELSLQPYLQDRCARWSATTHDADNTELHLVHHEKASAPMDTHTRCFSKRNQ